jgi:acid phosphatase type 7
MARSRARRFGTADLSNPVSANQWHDHDYERFAPQDPTGKLDPQRGIREFVVGTGGKNSHRTFASAQPNSEVHQADTFGVLKLTLHPTSYDWEFVPEAGKTFKDSGSGTCQ